MVLSPRGAPSGLPPHLDGPFVCPLPNLGQKGPGEEMEKWQEMDQKEKLDFLRAELQAMEGALSRLHNSTTAAVLSLNQRMKAVEEKATKPEP
jgi:hypothetical protein